MAINTQSELIEHLRFITGENSNSLPEADAVRLLNFGLDNYTHLAFTADGKWQIDEAENTDMPVATATLSSGAYQLPLDERFLAISFAEIEDAAGNRTALSKFDRSLDGRVTIKTTETGQPSAYDYDAKVLTFDLYADADYTVRVFFTRPFRHLVVGDSDQVTDISTIQTDYVVNHAAHRLSLRTGNEHRSQLKQELIQGAKDIQDDYGQFDEDGPVSLEISVDIRK